MNRERHPRGPAGRSRKWAPVDQPWELDMFANTPYETLIAALRKGDLTAEMRERVQAELQSRDRAAHNQWVAANGGEFK